MTHFVPHIFKRLSAALLFTTALGATAFAQSLPEIAPETIAQDVERRYDSRTGQTEYVAQTFDPFENDPALAGSAALRSADEAVTIDGQIVRGGAFLDISTIYTTSSADPYDVRGVEQGVFTSGQPVAVVRYDNKTLDCSRDVREVTYDDGYYSGASYGYIAGIYRLFPRYRGHRHYGWRRGYGGHRGYGHWRRRGHHGYGPGDVRRRRGGHGDVDRPRRRRPGDGDVRRRRPGDGDVDRPRRRRPGDVDRPRRRPRDGDGDVRRRRPGDGDVDRPRRRPRDGDVTRRRPGDGDVDRPRRRRPNVDRPDRRRPAVNRKRDDGTSVTVYRKPPNLEDAVGRPTKRVKRPKRRKVAPAPAPRPRVQTPPPRRVKPKAQPKPVSRPRVDRQVDKTFKSERPRGDRNKHRNFYPMVGGYTRTDVYVKSKCVKEETLTVHIPQDRLDAARFDGFAVILLDRAGREIPVFVPPNYVEGFRQAVSRPGSASYGYSQTVPASPPAPSSSRDPIIYGDPGYTPRAGYPQ